METLHLSAFIRNSLVIGVFTIIAGLCMPTAAEATYDWDYDWNQQPSCTLNVSDTSVEYNGTVILTWNATNASEATLTDFGSVPTSGTKTVHNLTGTRTYTLTVSKHGKSATCSKTVYVESQNVPTCWINANPSHVYDGNGTTLSWGSSNAQSASITDLGSVAHSGSRTVYPGYSRTYTMTVHNGSGQSSTCQTHVTVDNYGGGTPSCSITLSRNTYYNSSYYYNQPATLSWTSSGNVSSAYITPEVGSVSSSGSRTVYPTHNQIYTMTVYGTNGQSNTCQTSQYYPPQQYLSCTLTSSPDIVTSGGSAVLQWTVTGSARTATLSNYGSVSSNGGSMTVYPGVSRQYTLTVEDYYGTTRSCSTWVTAHGYATPTYPTYPTYPTTIVTLNQVPYTGVDLGPIGTALYFLTLSTLLVGGAYALFFWKGNIFSYALGGFQSNNISTYYLDEDEEEEEDEDEDDGSAAVLAHSRSH